MEFVVKTVLLVCWFSVPSRSRRSTCSSLRSLDSENPEIDSDIMSYSRASISNLLIDFKTLT